MEASQNFYFAIVNHDRPLYELEALKNEHLNLNQFIIHSSLDVLEDVQFTTTSNYLKTIDWYNDFMISAYVTPSGLRLMLLHENKNEDGIRSFFTEVHENLIKVVLNPFQNQFTTISSGGSFDSRVKTLAKRYL